MSIETYRKKHTEALVKDVGIEAACKLTGRSKATLGRYYSDQVEHGDRFMPIDVVAQLESGARHPHVTAAWSIYAASTCPMTATSTQPRPRASIGMW